MSLYENLSDEQKEEKFVELQKAFALACRFLDDNDAGCPANYYNIDWMECQGESEQCGDLSIWECWQKFFLGQAENEGVCRICGCTHYNACPGGCYWVKDDLCSSCAAADKPECFRADPVSGDCCLGAKDSAGQDYSRCVECEHLLPELTCR